MRTILEVTGKMDRGGAETMLVDIIKQTRCDFHYVFLINIKSGNDIIGNYDEDLKKMGCSFYYIGTVWDMGIESYTCKFIEICSQIANDIAPIDVVHCHMNSKCGTVLRAAKKAGIERRIAHSHAKIKFNGSLPIVLANYAELYFQKILINKYATDYWGCSKKALSSLYTAKNIRSDKCKIIKNAIDIHKFIDVSENEILNFRKKLKIPENKIVLGTVGRIARVKNVKFLIEIFAYLCKKNSDLYFVIVGGEQDKAYAEEIHCIIKQCKLEKNVLFTGIQTQLELVYPNFDIFLCASLREGLGLVAVEAQACGAHCVLSEGFPEEVDIGLDLVKIVKNFDVIKWAEIIEEILNSRNNQRLEKKKIEKKLKENGYDSFIEARKVKEEYEK